MTIQECREQHKKLWMWIAKETERLQEFVFKEDYFLAHPELPKPKKHCYLCEYALQFPYYGDMCVNCPLNDTKEECANSTSAYRKWKSNTKSVEEAAKLAEQIANLKF